MALAVIAALPSSSAQADSLRIATWSTELSRRGPGLLLRDILKGEDDQITAAIGVITAINPDVLLLADFDQDHGNAALSALSDQLEAAGTPYPHRFSLRSNAGMATGLDMDRNGRTGEPRDAQGYGRFAGHGGMALLSRFPIRVAEVQDFSSLLWRDLPGATLPTLEGAPFFPPEIEAVQRLSSTGHWAVPLALPGGDVLTLLAFSATPPVFDGPEDRNGLRNADEIGLWLRYLDGSLDASPPTRNFVLLGKANLDPQDGDGRSDAIRALLSAPRLRDPLPRSDGGANAASQGHTGDPALDTADWSEPQDNGPGNLRVDYVLPSADLTVINAGVHWPADGPEHAQVETASRHRLVWVDLETSP